MVAWRTPRSRTAPASVENLASSSRFRPNSLTSSAPDTPSVSCMWEFIAAFRSSWWRRTTRSNFPTRREA